MRILNLHLSPDAAAGGAKPDQADILARLGGMEAALAKTGLSLDELISQHASLSAGKATIDGDVARLTGDKAKLVAGANLPTDLVTAANDLHSLRAENATLKANAKSVDEAAAQKIVALGFTGTSKAQEQKPAKKPMSDTERALASKGYKTLAEAQEKFIESRK